MLVGRGLTRGAACGCECGPVGGTLRRWRLRVWVADWRDGSLVGCKKLLERDVSGHLLSESRSSLMLEGFCPWCWLTPW